MSEEAKLKARVVDVCQMAGHCSTLTQCELTGECCKARAAIRGAIIGTSGRKSETLVAKRLGARLTPASGAANSKGDMRKDRWLIEAKSTVRNSMSVAYAWCSKISREARGQGRKPAITITFVNSAGKPEVDGAWIMIPEVEYLELLEGQGK